MHLNITKKAVKSTKTKILKKVRKEVEEKLVRAIETLVDII